MIEKRVKYLRIMRSCKYFGQFVQCCGWRWSFDGRKEGEEEGRKRGRKEKRKEGKEEGRRRGRKNSMLVHPAMILRHFKGCN